MGPVEQTAAQLTAIAVVDRIRPKSWEEPFSTAIDKRPVRGRIPVGTLGLTGDVQADRKHHGGIYAAVYAYADEDAAWWADELGMDIPPGRFGENFRTSGIDVTGAEIGERWQVGTPGEGALLEVTSPRTPCRTFAEHMAQVHWVKRFMQRNALGAYLRVVEKGTVSAGDPIERVTRPGHGVTIGHAGKLAEPAAMQRLLDAAEDLGLDLDPGMRRFALQTARRA